MFKHWMAILLVVVVAVSIGRAQSPDDTPTEPALNRASLGWGFSNYPSGAWTTIGSTVVNPLDTPVEVDVVSWFKNSPDRQFGRRVWLPPRSVRRVTQPIITHKIDIEAFREQSKSRNTSAPPLISGDLQTVLLNTEGREHDRGNSSMIILDHDARGAVVRGDAYDDQATEMARMNAHSPSDTSGSGARRLPIPVQQGREPQYFGGWDQYRVVLVTRDQPHFNSLQLQALRQYLVRGGVVWITLDTVDPAFCEQLLGDSFTCRIVDRVQLNDMTFVDSNGSSSTASLEDPVDMARILAPGFEVEHTVEGWPATVWRQVGQGRLVVTTVGQRAWLGEGDVATGHLLDVDQLTFGYQQPETVAETDRQEMADSYIGYEIMGRQRVVVVLAVFIVALVVSGLLLAQMKRLEWQSLVAAILAIGATLVLMGMGSAHLKQTPTTVASVQWVRVAEHQDVASVDGMHTAYAQASTNPTFNTTQGGVGAPMMTDAGSDRLQMIWTDLNRWHWRTPQLHPGPTRNYQSRNVIPLEQPVNATLRLGAETVTGKINGGRLTGLSDPIIATRFGRLVPRLTEAGFQVDARQRAGDDQFFTGTVALNDKQLRRLEIYRPLLNRTIEKPSDYYPLEPTLLVWADAVDDGMSLDMEAQRHASALVEVPLRYEPVEAGTKVHVPAALIERYNDRGPDGNLRVTPYDYRRDEWFNHRTSAMMFMFRFELPDVVRNLDMTKGVLRVHLDAPRRPLELLDPTTMDPEPIDVRSGPQGTAEFDLAQWEVFQPDENGHVRIRLRIGEVDLPAEATAGQTYYWGIAGMSLEVDGIVLEPDTPSE